MNISKLRKNIVLEKVANIFKEYSYIAFISVSPGFEDNPSHSTEPTVIHSYRVKSNLLRHILSKTTSFKHMAHGTILIVYGNSVINSLEATDKLLRRNNAAQLLGFSLIGSWYSYNHFAGLFNSNGSLIDPSMDFIYGCLPSSFYTLNDVLDTYIYEMDFLLKDGGSKSAIAIDFSIAIADLDPPSFSRKSIS
jgi:hypothetical protein